jgi:anthranilate synthase component II
VHHNNAGIFHTLPSPFTATRYHSLILDPASIPDCLEITAFIEASDKKHGEIMGIRHRSLPIEGLQFHPESIMTQHGHALLANFLAL